MRILLIYNHYRSGSCGGEIVGLRQTIDMLTKRGHTVRLVERDSRTIVTLRDKMSAFANGMYSWQAKREMEDIIESYRPDIAHANNLYPLFSPSVLVACRKQGVPVIMTLHNFGLTCPAWYHLHKGRVCERCLGGREYWCVLQNCRENVFESAGYALRTAVARSLRLFSDNVTLFIALTHFAKHRLVSAGVEERQIAVAPFFVALPDSPVDPSGGEYVAFAGRLSPEKGIDTLLTAARNTGLPVRIAGDGPAGPRLVREAPSNVEFVGKLDRAAIETFYRSARFTVVPSTWFENFPLVVAEPMSHGVPVITSKIGGLPEIVEDGVTGLLSEPGNAEDLAVKMRRLWDSPELCRRMGQAGREKAIREYSPDRYYERLMALYTRAIDICQSSTARTLADAVRPVLSTQPSTLPGGTPNT